MGGRGASIGSGAGGAAPAAETLLEDGLPNRVITVADIPADMINESTIDSSDIEMPARAYAAAREAEMDGDTELADSIYKPYIDKMILREKKDLVREHNDTVRSNRRK